MPRCCITPPWLCLCVFGPTNLNYPVELPFVTTSGEVSREEKMALRGTDPESSINQYTLVYDDKFDEFVPRTQRVNLRLAGQENIYSGSAEERMCQLARLARPCTALLSCLRPPPAFRERSNRRFALP